MAASRSNVRKRVSTWTYYVYVIDAPGKRRQVFLRKQETYNKAHPDKPLPSLVLHGLRHTWATLALLQGIDIHVVSDRLAHSSTCITSEIYPHATRPMQSDAAERVAARILRGTGHPPASRCRTD